MNNGFYIGQKLIIVDNRSDEDEKWHFFKLDSVVTLHRMKRQGDQLQLFCQQGALTQELRPWHVEPYLPTVEVIK